MIRQRFLLPLYDWRVRVYYAVDRYYADEILYRLAALGCKGDDLRSARANLRRGKLNEGFTFSNPDMQQSLMVIEITSTPEQFQNSYDHEKGHLAMHIAKYYGMNPYGEETQYLAGEIGQKMFPVAKMFLCEHCRCGLKRLIEEEKA